MTLSSPLNPDVIDSAKFVQRLWSKQPLLGIILGTGSGQIADSIQVDESIDYESIPNFPSSTAIGHSGKLVCGTIRGQNVVALKGRFHPYEGHSFERVTLPIHLFHALGIDRVLITNAAGGLNPKFAVGDLMAITSHVDFMNLTSFRFGQLAGPESAHRCIRRSDEVMDHQLIDQAIQVARREGFSMDRGVYAGLLGPNYETRAEIRMLRRTGCDAVGMSTIGEIAAARLFAMKVLAISVITNLANPDQLQETSGQEVVDSAKVAEPRLLAIVQDLVKRL